MASLRLHSVIGQDVEITSTQGEVFKGCVKAIDPSQESYILLIEEKGKMKLNYINGTFIKCVNSLGRSKLAEVNLFPPEKLMSEDEVIELKNKVKDWFHTHRMDIKEDGLKLILYNTVTIQPPYRPSDCSSSNIVVLERVQDLMASFPRG